MIFLRPEAMDNGGIELVCMREVGIKATAVFEPLGTQGTLVEAARRVEEERVVLELSVAGSGKDAVWAVERWQGWRHSPVGNDGFCR